MTEYIYQQSIIQFRIPILLDGKLGTPEIMAKFHSNYNGASKYKKKAAPKPIIQKKIPITLKVEESEEEFI